jgi:hypothetical protein
MRALAMAATVIFAVSSCGLHQPDVPAPAADMPPGASGSEPVVRQQGDATIIMEPARAVQEVVSPQDGARCAIDAAKICAAYGQLAPAASVSAEPGRAASDSITVTGGPGPAAGDSRTVSLQIPNGPAIAVQCRYAGPGGALVSAAAPNTPLDGDSRAFLAAHGFCAAGPGG